MRLAMVDFPLPLSPMSPTHSPSSTEKDTSVRAENIPPPVDGNFLFSCSTSRMGKVFSSVFV